MNGYGPFLSQVTNVYGFAPFLSRSRLNIRLLHFVERTDMLRFQVASSCFRLIGFTGERIYSVFLSIFANLNGYAPFFRPVFSPFQLQY